MKVISKTLFIFFILVFVVVIQSCTKNERRMMETTTSVNFKTKTLINAFISSTDYKSLNVEFLGHINIEKSGVTYVENDKNKPVLNIVFMKNNKISGVIEAIRNINKNILLPNHQMYFMLLRDLTRFDTDKKTGTIKLVDLNYDNHTINTIVYKNSNTVEASFSELPVSIKTKYRSIARHNLGYKSKTTNALHPADPSKKKAIPCDENKNGNLSFAECYTCFNKACGGDSTCYTLCYGIGDVAGWLIAKLPHCQVSIAAACIYLSMKY